MNKTYGQLLVGIVLVMLTMFSTSCDSLSCYNSVYKMTGVDTVNRNITKVVYSAIDGHEVGDTLYSEFVIEKMENNQKISCNANCRWVIVKVIDDGTRVE